MTMNERIVKVVVTTDQGREVTLEGKGRILVSNTKQQLDGVPSGKWPTIEIAQASLLIDRSMSGEESPVIDFPASPSEPQES